MDYKVCAYMCIIFQTNMHAVGLSKIQININMLVHLE